MLRSSAALRSQLVGSFARIHGASTSRLFSSRVIAWTVTDESPALATRSLIPIVKAFTAHSSVKVELRDISLTARILASFPDKSGATLDTLGELGALCKTPDANIVKLPNISASVPQLQAAIDELRAAGFDMPEFPQSPSNDEEREIAARYAKVLGSAVNPVLREGNSDRRCPSAVKQFAKQNPHTMGQWSSQSKTHVATMQAGDFFANEQSVTFDQSTRVRIEFTPSDVDSDSDSDSDAEHNGIQVWKNHLDLQAGEILDATFMSKKALCIFLNEQIADAKEQDVLLSLHMKATMMKVSDPIIFSHAVEAFFEPVFTKHRDTLASVGVNTRNGFGDLVTKIKALPQDKQDEIQADIDAVYASRPSLAMVNSDRGITNLHVPSDVIVDASMPAMIRESGRMWNAQGEPQDTKAIIPDSSYAGVFQAVIDDCRQNGAFDPCSMGNVSNVGLMAQKAEEYGSHDKTFEVPSSGVVRVVDAQSGKVLTEHKVEQGDVWRACQTKDAPVCDWVKLAVSRARATKSPAVFWLDEKRAHDRQIMDKVHRELEKTENLDDIEILIMSPEEATTYSIERLRAGKDTISVSGNVLRDFLTDLFPILELGTSAKVLSVVPLMAGGGLFETGAGGSAPKLVEQFVDEGHLRWDSLGEFLALAESLRHAHAQDKLNGVTGAESQRTHILADALDEATTQYLLQQKEPQETAGELDIRGSHFYLAQFWARAVANQTKDSELAAKFAPVADQLSAQEQTILDEIRSKQGSELDLGGWYLPNDELANAAMRPSATFNNIIDSLRK